MRIDSKALTARTLETPNNNIKEITTKVWMKLIAEIRIKDSIKTTLTTETETTRMD